jgi:hypothetical protein
MSTPRWTWLTLKTFAERIPAGASADGLDSPNANSGVWSIAITYMVGVLHLKVEARL